ncbi:MAG: Sua5/YciO/YrdC/YwlC family protein [Rubripirellula sp.]|nr:Sua5/YciO/YrdC/YwlC family protein [Rubripirellula sp.]
MLTTLDLRAAPDTQDFLHRTVQTLAEGGLVAVPTESTYGLIAHSLNPKAIQTLKNWYSSTVSALPVDSPTNKHPFDQTLGGPPEFPDPPPFCFLVPSTQAAEDYLLDWSPLISRLARRCWPGPLQIEVIPSDASFDAKQLFGGGGDLCLGGSGRVAFRVISQRIIQGIHRYLPGPIVFCPLGSASGRVVTTATEAKDYLPDSVPLLLDDGPTRYGGSPTRVTVEKNRYQILHQGAIEEAAMNQFVKPVIVLVCTGNTCRSPMAETLLRERFRVKFGREDLVRVLSAGVAAADGYGASSQAVEVMGQRGLDLTGHSSRSLDDELINIADVILTMTRGHRSAILAAWPELESRVRTLRRDGGDVSDPVGMPVEVYQSCADQIDLELEAWIDGLDEDFFPSNLAGV